MGLGDIAVKVADTITFQGSAVEGAYSRKIIAVSLTSESVKGTLDHEAIHAIKEAGLFTKTEWSILTKQAASEWRSQYNIDRTWEGLAADEDALNEEAVAEAYRDWRDGADQAGLIARIFNKLRNALSAIKEVLTGFGFNTPEDIFGRVARGEVGARERGPAGAPQPDKFSPHTDDETPPLGDAFDTMIAAAAKHLGWEGEPTSAAMFAKAQITPKGPAKTEMTRNAGLIKALEEQRASPFMRQPADLHSATGDTKVRGLAQHISDRAGTNAGNFEKPTYDVSDQADQMKRANAFVSADYEGAKKVAMGRAPEPYGVMAQAVMIAVENRATREGDWNLLRDLGTRSGLLEAATEHGQRSSIFQQRDQTSPVAAIKAVQTARQGAAKKAGLDGSKAKKETVKDMLASVKKETDRSAKKITWEKFIHELTCKE